MPSSIERGEAGSAEESSSAALAPAQMPPSDPSPSAPEAQREEKAGKRVEEDDDDEDQTSTLASVDAFGPLETILSDARRDVTAVAGWGPDAALVALDGGCLLVLRRDTKREEKGEASSAIPSTSSSTSSASIRKSVPTTTASGSTSTTSTSALADAALPWRLTAAHSHLASKRITQLEVVSSGSGGSGGSGGSSGEGSSSRNQQLLLALTEEGVTAFRLPGFTMTAQADRTAGSSRFAWQPGPRLLAVVAGGGGGSRKKAASSSGILGSKKVSVFNYTGKEFVPLRELAAPEPPLAVAWAGPAVLVSGSSGSWWALRSSSSAAAAETSSSSSSLPATEEIFPSPSSSSSSSSSSRDASPLACPFSFSEGGEGSSTAAAVTLGRRGAALVGGDGRPARGGRAASLWRGAGAPAALAGSPPWLCAALPGGVEVRPLDPSLSSDLLCQTLPLACMAVASSSSPASSSNSSGIPSSFHGNDVFFAGGGRVARLRPRRLVDVAADACAGGRLADAVALASLAPEADPRRGAALDGARRALAGSAFASGDFDGALALLGMVGRSRRRAGRGGGEGKVAAAAAAAAVAGTSSSTSRPASPVPAAFGPRDAAAPLALLRFFPSLAPADLLEAAEGSCCCESGEEDEEEEGAEGEGEEEGGEGIGDGGQRRRRRRRRQTSSWPAPKLPPEPTGEAYEKAVAALLPYLLSFRGRLIAAVGSGSGEEKEDETTTSTPSSSSSSSSTLSPAALDSLATLVDTAVLLAMLAAPDDSGAALRFVSSASPSPPRCRLSDVSPRLAAKGRYSELVALLRGAGRHEAALDLLRRLSTEPQTLEAKPTGAAADLAGAVTGAWAAARYLRSPVSASTSLPSSLPSSSSSSSSASSSSASSAAAAAASSSLGGARPDLVHEHGRWIVAADADAGLDLLLGLEPPPPPEAALAVLRSRQKASSAAAADPGVPSSSSPGLAASYLAAAVERGIAPAARWEGELAGLCLRAALEEGKEKKEGKEGKEASSSSPPFPPPPVGPARGAELSYSRLLSLVDESPHVDPQRLLALLPAGALLAARARLLSRLGRVSEALRVAAVELGDDELAEAIAARAAERQRRGGEGKAHAAAAGEQGKSESGDGSSNSDPASAPASVDPYLELIRLFLQRDEKEEGEEEGGKGGKKGWAAAARLLATAAPPSSSPLDASSSSSPSPSPCSSSSSSSSRRARPVLDPAAAIDHLPEDGSLVQARALVAAALSGAREARAAAAIGKGLSRADALGARAAAAAARRRGVKLTSERGCAACGKAFAAGTAFALLPAGGGVVHYGCFKARERAAAGRSRGATTTTEGEG